MDEFPGIVAKPISHNAYAYVHNDPINNVDPDGHWPQWVSNAWNKVTSFVSNAASTIWNAVESAASWVRNQVEAAASWVSTKVEQAANWVSAKKKKIYKTAKAAVQKAKQKVISYKDSVAAKAQAAEKKAAEAKRQAEEKLKQMVADGKEAFEDTVSEGKERAQQAFEAIKSSGAGNYQGTSNTDNNTGSKILNGVQTGLDVAGLVPGFGEIADGTNALIYLARGDKTNAALSAAAIIPFAGWAATGGKLAKKSVKVLEEADGIYDAAKGMPNANLLPGRNGALNQAKRDAGILRSQHPDAVESVPMKSAPHEGGHVIKDANGNVIYTREYYYTNQDGKNIIIQEHSAGHTKGDQGPHFNVRPIENPRTGSVPGTNDHYPFNK